MKFIERVIELNHFYKNFGGLSFIDINLNLSKWNNESRMLQKLSATECYNGHYAEKLDGWDCSSSAMI